MIRILHFSDYHLGSDSYGKPNPETGINQRIHDFADRFDELIDFALGNEVDVVLFSGDAFKNAHPTPTVQKMLAERVWRLAKAGIQVFLLAGNHDLPRMIANVTAFSVYPALEVDNVTVAERAGVYTLDTAKGERLQIAAMPHFWRSALLAQIDRPLSPTQIDDEINALVAAKVNHLAEQINPSVPVVMTAHLHVDKANVSTAQELYGVSDFQIPLSSLAHKAFPYVALGHIHKPQTLSDDWRNGTYAAYSGSLERVDFGEEKENKGFYIVDMENGRLVREPHFEHESLNTRRFVTVNAIPSTDAPTEGVVAEIAKNDITQAIVRVRVTAPRDLYATIDQESVRRALAPAYDARVQPIYEQEQVALRDPRFQGQLSEAQALEEYVRSEFAPDADDLLRLGRELINDVVSGAGP